MKTSVTKTYIILSLMLFAWQIAYSQDEVITLRMMTYNIRHGAGQDNVVDLDRQATLIQKGSPDVIGLQEVDSCVKRSGYIPEAALLAEKLRMHSTFGGAIPLTGGKYGVAILSKEVPLAVHHLPLPGEEKRTLLVCEFQDYVFATTHLDLNDSCRQASLPIILEEANRHDKPFFICGDWNDKPTDPFIKEMKKQGFLILNNITESANNYTFPARNPNCIIDYIASYGKRYKSIMSRNVIADTQASDHRPVLVAIRLQSYATGLGEVKNENQTNVIYDLQGREVASAKMRSDKCPKGIYIQAGHKRLMK